MKKIALFLSILLFMGISMANAQTKVLTGTVTSSEDGTPIPGVSVAVKGTTLGTITNIDGEYSLQVPEDAQTLVASFVGMKKQEIPIGSSTTIDIVMEPDVFGIDEVVVTAMGISQERKGLGYNVQEVSSEKLSTKPNADIVNSLSGQTSGVQITSSAGDAGASTYITIRGAASITGNNQPLFVVNGMPIISSGGSGDVGGVTTSSRSIDINPDDIESITVLKGGAATALYGLRAANGALIITTKSGKSVQQKKIEFHTSVSFDEISQVPERQSMWAQGNNGSWIGGNAASFGPKISELEYDGDTDYKWDPNGRLVPKGTGNGVPAKAYDQYSFFQTGVSTNNRLNISNGNDMGSYYFSISHLNQEGIIPNNIYKRLTMRLNATTKLHEKVTIGTDFAYTNSVATQIQKGSNVSGVMLGLVRSATTFDNSAGYEFPDGTQRNYRNGGGYDNPYWTANNIAFDENVNRFTGSGNLNIRFTDYLSLSYTAGVDWFNRRYQDKFANNSRAYPSGYVEEYMNYNGIFNSDLLLNFQTDISESFNIKATLGHNMYETFFKRITGSAEGLEIERFYQLSNSANAVVSTATSNYRTAAIFGDIHLAWNDMLYLGITGRNDWSTTMPEANLSAFYPSVSLGFVFTELSAFEGSFLTFGKLRASAARTANIAGAYNTTNYFYSAGTGDGWTNGAGFPYQGQTGFQVGTTLGSPDLKHETMDSWEVGLEARMFNGRVGFDVSYFENLNKDLLMEVPIARSSGFASVYKNAATMESKGIELSFDAAIVQSNSFQWDILANFTKMTNTVTELAEGVDNIFLGGFTVPQVRAVVGEEYGSVFGNDWYRDSNGNVLINDDPGDNLRDGYPFPDTRSMVPIGNTNPDWTANITNTFTYKDLSLSFLVDIKKGGMMYNGTAFAMNYFGTHKRTENREVYYTPEGTIDFDLTPSENIVVFDGVYGHVDADGNPVSSGQANVTPVVLDEDWFEGNGSNFGGGPSVAAMEPAGWVRLRDITLSYSLPVKNTFLSDAMIYVSGKNLLLFTPYTGVDPETNLLGSSNARGMDYFNNPGTKTYMVGLKVTF
ncbi:SusC/RagA family TonB-linked outer membrane protein [Maribellus maritimus]|uniref:SusC/RagA family TonB-linked outer membrane protein n=1 Tax=Maribellus maritimus TaxID=2870838 RepID=UPI001EEB30BE|nr:SusC/RagA family TonB-linked outer membrane protein [Maribellus maritimus]MCG6186078.1 SusC/RagA family TonB-linked outer membrane protein [Maribellus maritimus]